MRAPLTPQQIAVGWVYALPPRFEVFHVVPHGRWLRQGIAMKREQAEAVGMRACASGCASN